MDKLDGTWRKSRRSNNAGACVEVRYTRGEVQVRDSKDSGGPALGFSPRAWTTFVAIATAADGATGGGGLGAGAGAA
jgi:hypothetical protein